MVLENKDKREIALYVSCTCVNEHGIWIMNGMLPIFYFYSFEKKEIVSYEVIPGYKNQEMALFCSIYETNKELFFIPNNGRRIIAYEKQLKKFSEIKLENECMNMFRGCLFYEGVLYCIPYRYNYIVGLDVKSHKVFIESDWKAENGLENDYYTNGFAVVDGKILLAVPKTNRVFEYDLRMHRWQLYSIGSKENSYTYICCLGNFFCLFEQNKKEIYLVDIKYERIIRKRSVNFSSVNLISKDYETVVIDDVETDKWLIIDSNLDIIRENNYNYKKLRTAYASPYKVGCWFKKMDNNMCCIDCYNNLFELSEEGYCITQDFMINSDVWSESLSMNSIINRKDVCDENDVYTLSLFISDLVKNEI